jgi:hypothetical protein
VSTSQDPSLDDVVVNDEADDKLSTVSARVGDVTRRLKPVAESVAVQTVHAAEAIAGHAVHLSAAGLNRVDAYLIERRDRRQNSAADNALPETVATGSDLPVDASLLDEGAASADA